MWIDGGISNLKKIHPHICSYGSISNQRGFSSSMVTVYTIYPIKYAHSVVLSGHFY